MPPKTVTPALPPATRTALQRLDEQVQGAEARAHQKMDTTFVAAAEAAIVAVAIEAHRDDDVYLRNSAGESQTLTGAPWSDGALFGEESRLRNKLAALATAAGQALRVPGEAAFALATRHVEEKTADLERANTAGVATLKARYAVAGGVQQLLQGALKLDPEDAWLFQSKTQVLDAFLDDGDAEVLVASRAIDGIESARRAVEGLPDAPQIDFEGPLTALRDQYGLRHERGGIPELWERGRAILTGQTPLSFFSGVELPTELRTMTLPQFLEHAQQSLKEGATQDLYQVQHPARSADSPTIADGISDWLRNFASTLPKDGHLDTAKLGTVFDGPMHPHTVDGPLRTVVNAVDALVLELQARARGYA